MVAGTREWSTIELYSSCTPPATRVRRLGAHAYVSSSKGECVLSVTCKWIALVSNAREQVQTVLCIPSASCATHPALPKAHKLDRPKGQYQACNPIFMHTYPTEAKGSVFGNDGAVNLGSKIFLQQVEHGKSSVAVHTKA